MYSCNDIDEITDGNMKRILSLSCDKIETYKGAGKLIVNKESSLEVMIILIFIIIMIFLIYGSK